MSERTRAIQFPGANGDKLAAALDLPAQDPIAYALFAHCFTCGKNNNAAVRISRALADLGLAVLRFDFTGLGASEGEFANTNFSSNVEDLLAAAEYLRAEYAAPSVLIGHSLGGAAALAAAGDMPELKAVVTINAPFDPNHVTRLFQSQKDQIQNEGEAEVSIAGRSFQVKRHFLKDISEVQLKPQIEDLGRALLVFHAPLDEEVSVDNARLIFDHARHPKSFISLDDADHLLSRKSDAAYVASTLAAWVERYLPETQPASESAEQGVVTVSSREGTRFVQNIRAGEHQLVADEPEALGGSDLGPSPYEYLLAALGTCTSMTLREYASRKQLPLSAVQVTLRHFRRHASDCVDCETKAAMLDHIERDIVLQGALSAEQRAQLLAVADKCPVHRTLQSKIEMITRERAASPQEN